MSSAVADESKRILYLQQLDIDTATRTKFRAKLFVNDVGIDIDRRGKSSIWIPARTPEISSISLVLVVIKAGYTVAGVSVGRLEERTDISGDEITRVFWDSENSEFSISRQLTFDGQPMTISFQFHSSSDSDLTRTAFHKLQTAIKDFKPLMTNSMQHLDRIMKFGTAISEMNSYAKAAFSVATVTLELLKEQQKYDSMASDLVDTIERIFPFINQVEEALSGDSETLGPLQEVVGKLGALILGAAEFICSYVHRSALSTSLNSCSLLGADYPAERTVRSTEDQIKITSLSEDLRKLIEDFSRGVGVETLAVTKKTLSLDEIRFLENRLKPISAGYDPDKCCMLETRKSILDSIITWALQPLENDAALNSNKAAKIFWLYGIPGLGKTSVASSLCAQLHEKKRLGGSFFCRRDDPHLGNPKYALPTLIYNLAGMWRPYRKLLVEKLKQDLQLNPASAGNSLLLQLLSQLQSLPPHPLVVVIDALDECGEPKARQSILRVLFEASLQFSQLKVIVTSRQERDIEAFFQKIESPNLYQSQDLGMDEAAQADVSLYAQSRFALIAADCHLPDDWPGKKILAKVLERARGLFIYVETVWRLIKDDSDPDTPLIDAIDATSGDALSDLHVLYSSAIKSRIGKRVEEFRRLIGVIVVVASYRPLCDASAARLAGLGAPLVQTLVDKLSSLLYRDERHEGGVRVRHISIVDFLTSAKCPLELRVDLRQANLEVGLACITTMLNELKFNICGLETSLVANRDVRDLAYRVRSNIPDALQYSCLYWASHLCSTPYSANSNITKKLNEFFQDSRPLYWIEVLSIMGQVSTGIHALRQILSWAKDSDDRYTVCANDTLRLLLTFNTPITMSTPHIYISTLPFLPSGSDLWKIASRQFKKLLQLPEGRMEFWPSRPDTWLGHTAMVRGIAYSPDGRHVVSGSVDGTIRLWSTETGTTIGEPWRGHEDSIYSAIYSPDGRDVASSSGDTTIRLWDAQTGMAIGEPLKGHTKTVSSIAYSQDGRYLISGSFDTTMRLWNAETGDTIGEPWVGHTGPIYSVAHSPDGLYVASGSEDKTVRLWDSQTGMTVGEPWKGHTSPVSSIAYSPDGRFIISGSWDRTIRLWNVETRTAVGGPWDGHKSIITAVAYSPDGQSVISSSIDHKIRMWDSKTGSIVREPWMGHRSPIQSIAYSPNGQYVVSGSFDGILQLWDAHTGRTIGERQRRPTMVSSIAYSPDGRHTASESKDRAIQLWDAKTGEAVGEPWRGHNDQITTIIYSPRGRYIASGSLDSTIRLWDTETGAAVGEPWTEHTASVESMAYSPDGLYLVSGSGDNTIRLWNTQTGAVIGEPWKGHTDEVYSVAYSPDGLYVVSGSLDCTIRLWNAHTGTAIGEPWKGHTRAIHYLVYSPDGRHVLSGSADKTIRMWDARTGSVVGEPWRGHASSVVGIAYSPDGQHVVSSSSDKTIRLWDANTGTTIGEPWEGHGGSVTCIAYSPDGLQVASGSYDDTIRIWDAHPSRYKWNSALFSGQTQAQPTLFDITIDPTPDDDGWVLHPDGGLLFWVPENCREGFTCQATVVIPTAGHRIVRLDLADFRYGPRWSEVKAMDR